MGNYDGFGQYRFGGGGGGGGGSAGTNNEFQITDNTGGFLASIMEQTAGLIGINGTTASAQFAINSTTLGFLTPRMTTAQQGAISTPATGLQIYNTDDDTPNYNHSVDGWIPVGRYANVGATVNGGNAPIGNQHFVSSNTDGEINYAPFRWTVSATTPYIYGVNANTLSAQSSNLGASSTNVRWLTLFFRGYLDHQYGKMRWTTGTNAGAKFEQGSLRVGFTSTASQGGIIVRNDGVDTYDLDTSAMLELRSTSKGFVPPRMTTAQMNAISSPIDGLMIYDTTTNQWMGYDGTSWVIIG